MPSVSTRTLQGAGSSSSTVSVTSPTRRTLKSPLPPSKRSSSCRCVPTTRRLPFQRHDLAHDLPLNVRILVDRDVRNRRIVGQIVVYDLAVKAVLGDQGFAPTGGLIV